ELILWCEPDRLLCDVEARFACSVERSGIERARRFTLSFHVINTAIGMHKLKFRACLADEIAARAQRIAARVLLGHRDKPKRSKKCSPRAVAFSTAETEPAQASKADHGRVLDIITGDAERLHCRQNVPMVDYRGSDRFRFSARAVFVHVPTILSF